MKRDFDLSDCLGGELIEVKVPKTEAKAVVEEVVVEAKVEVEEAVEAKAEAAEAEEAEEAGRATPDPNAVLPPQFAALVGLIGAETQTETEADELEGTKERPQAVAMEPKAVDAVPRRWGCGASPGLLREEGGVIAYMQSLRS